MKRLFQRFRQASAKTYSQYGGSGLGLFISRELTELQGGQIGVYSVPGQGSTFAFYVKARRPAPSEGQAPPDRSGDEAISGPPKHSIPECADAAALDTEEPRADSIAPQVPSDLHILLVEDNLINQKVTAQQLRKIGCTVHVANHGVECLDFLERSCYWRDTPAVISSATETAASTSSTTQTPLSVILLDQEMPVMDGLTCVRRIREMQRERKLTGHVPVIACTGNARREQVVSSLEAGMVCVSPMY